MMKNIFFQDPDNRRYWITAAVIVKALFFFFMFFQRPDGLAAGSIYVDRGDASSYLRPIDSLFEGSGYFPDHRMPGYGALYFLFKLIFSKVAALNMLAAVQLFLSALSVYVLALTARRVFSSERLFYASFYLYLFSTYTSLFDIHILPESLFTSGLIFALFYFVKADGGIYKTSVFLSGLFFSWCVFLKPICLPLFCLFALALFVFRARDRKSSLIKAAGAVSLFLTVFVLVDGSWVLRNYKVHGRVIPLQRSVDYDRFTKDAATSSMFDFIRSWGGDITWWNPGAEINWFGYLDNEAGIKSQIKDTRIPAGIYTSAFDYGDLETVKDQLVRSKDKGLPEDERDRLRLSAAQSLREYASSIKRERPGLYYIKAPLRNFTKFLFHSGTYNLFKRTYKDLDLHERAFKILMSLLYAFTVVFGILGVAAVFIMDRGFNYRFLFAAVPFYLVAVYPFVFRYCEYRYFAPAYPFMLACAVYFLLLIYSRIADRNPCRT